MVKNEQGVLSISLTHRILTPAGESLTTGNKRRHSGGEKALRKEEWIPLPNGFLRETANGMGIASGPDKTSEKDGGMQKQQS